MKQLQSLPLASGLCYPPTYQLGYQRGTSLCWRSQLPRFRFKDSSFHAVPRFPNVPWDNLVSVWQSYLADVGHTIQLLSVVVRCNRSASCGAYAEYTYLVAESVWYPNTAQSVQKPTFVPHDNEMASDATIDTIRAVFSLSSTAISNTPFGKMQGLRF